jgi:AcrR family transcriptional regulator
MARAGGAAIQAPGGVSATVARGGDQAAPRAATSLAPCGAARRPALGAAKETLILPARNARDFLAVRRGHGLDNRKKVNTVHFVNGVHEVLTPRLTRRKERLDGIIAAARGVIEKEGLEALSLHRLARELGLVTAALYRYFPSKDALLAELQRQTISELHAELRATTELARSSAERSGLDARAGALAEIFSVSDFYLALPTNAPEHFGLISVLLADPRPLVSADEAKKTAPYLLSFLDDVRSLLARAADAGALAPGDAFDRTLVLWSALQGSSQLGKISRFEPKRFDARRLGREALRALLAGWGACDADVARAVSAADRQKRNKKRKESP